MMGASLGWSGIVRLGVVQSAIGAIVMLATSLLNRVMVVEYALPAALPAGLVAWHYAVQLTRPLWGHGSDAGRRRTPWVIGGMVVLAAGAMLAVAAIGFLPRGASPSPELGFGLGGALAPSLCLALAVLGFTLIGGGVGAAGTSLLALLATRVAPERRAAAAAITWIMMVAGIALSAGFAGALLTPFSFARLQIVVDGIAAAAVLVATLAVLGVEGAGGAGGAAPRAPSAPSTPLSAALAAVWADRRARGFTGFVFVSMLAYAMQDLILEPFTGLRFGMTPSQSTQISGIQHGGVLLGMILAGVGGGAFDARRGGGLQRWIVGGCIGSALALGGLALAARAGPGWPILANIFALGFANGVFAVAAIGAMMALAGADGDSQAGLRMGVWGAAQAVAFGLGGLSGAVAVDAGRALIGSLPMTFMLVFGGEGLLFLLAATLALEPPRRARAIGREVAI